ncbi:restriction endonuclease [Methylocystis parvus]|uniref:Restriction endonuclease n=1 Tax=Methylocystis parvus TaxID=134 RepID=A0A6B8LXK5_9HYPH|nr:restriction endonuclease [Methylocystis parvus]QGM96184.1 restriction endonuclease [Methylocystis parvus]WBJ99990.1 restriction endonuclease [Methylocystis parvus OBBP]
MTPPQEGDGVALWVGWIFLFLALAGCFWPRMPGLAFMGLALFGVLHLAVLVHERIAEPRFFDGMSPEEFEHYCAELLRRAKWRAEVTPASGDQGVDIVAEKRGRRIVVQCKMYSKPVGNRAVQEIVAGIAHAEAERGVVVTTVGYTAAAQALAESNNVLLLRHQELRRIDRLLARTRA